MSLGAGIALGCFFLGCGFWLGMAQINECLNYLFVYGRIRFEISSEEGDE